MKEYDARSDNEGVCIPELYALATSTRSRSDGRLITTQEGIHEQVKKLNCGQASSTMGFPGLTYNYDSNEFLMGIAPIDGTVNKVVFTFLPPPLLH